MRRCEHYLLILSVCLALLHVPVPWWHQHDGIDVVSLVRHFASYHRGVPVSDVPVGWHFHLLHLDATFSPLADCDRTSQQRKDAATAISDRHDQLDRAPWCFYLAALRKLAQSKAVSYQQTSLGRADAIPLFLELRVLRL